jgi:ribonuclease D
MQLNHTSKWGFSFSIKKCITMSMSIITDTNGLANFCERLANSNYITVDTEFIREKTYWPQLCLIQLADQNEAFAVDALAKDIDLTPLLELMANKQVLKVFHAARQDLEIFYLLAGKLPQPLFDTQVAAMVCGFGESVGYETLVNRLVGEAIDKSSRYTDWSARPLTEKQLNYAISDVTYLRTVYELLETQLTESGRQEWVLEEMAKLTNETIYEAPPREAWLRIKTRNPKPRFLAILREVAAWRETEAKSKDIPRNRILRDEALIEIAHHAPGSVNELARTRGLSQRLAEGTAGQNILEAVETGKNIPDIDCPKLQRPPNLPRGIGPVSELLKVLLKMKCEEQDVAQPLIATGGDIEKISAYGEKADVAALKGWRRPLFGQDAINLRDGKLALVINNQKLELVELDDS